MFAYGIFVCRRDLTPVSREELVRGVPRLKREIHFLYPCFVYVLDDAAAAMEFGGAPVNMVVITDEYVGTDYLSELTHEFFDGAVVFVIPYVPAVSETFDDSQVIGEIACGWMPFATEAAELSATEPVLAGLNAAERPLTHSV